MEKNMKMIENLQSKIIHFFIFNSRKIIILALTFFGIILVSNCYADDIFNVELKCKDRDQENCDVIKKSNKKTTFILKKMRYPQVDRISPNVYHVYGSCGSPCQYHIFISRSQEDQTKEFIALNENNNCLIESDSKNNFIYARNLFNKNRKKIVNLKNKEFNNVPIDTAIYNSFQEKSYFDNEGQLHLIAMLADIDKNGDSLYFNKIIKKTCE